jgi:hypothetical protein
MKSHILFLYRGTFGSRAAKLAASDCGNARLIDLDTVEPYSLIDEYREGKAVVFLSDASGAGINELAERFREANVTWTSVHLYPTMLRIGPTQHVNGVCYECATKRYLSNPGSQGLARLEDFLRNGADVVGVEFSGTIMTIVAMAATEALRQIHDDSIPAGYIRKIDLVDHSMSAAVAMPLHGCDCADQKNDGAEPGARFYCELAKDLQGIIGRNVK